MKWFRDLSIIKKLLLGFGIVGGMGAAIFACGVVTIRAVVRSNAALYENGACALDQVTNLSTAYQQVLLTLRDAARSQNSEEVRQQIELRKAYSSLVTQSLDLVEPSVSAPSARQLIEEFRKYQAGLLREMEKFDELALAGKRGGATTRPR